MLIKYLKKHKKTSANNTKIFIDRSEYENLLKEKEENSTLKLKCAELENILEERNSSHLESVSKLDEYKTYFEILEEEVNNQQNEIISFDNQIYNIVTRVTEVSHNAKNENIVVEETYSILCETTKNIQYISNSINSMFENISSLSEFVKDGTTKVNQFKNQIDIICSSLNNFKESYNILKKEISNLSYNNKQIKSISSQTKLVAMNALIHSAKANVTEYAGQQVINRELQKLSQSALVTSKNTDTTTSKINIEILKFSNDIEKLFSVIYTSFDLITSSLKVFSQLELSNNNLIKSADVVKNSLKNTNDGVNKMISSIEKMKDTVEKNYINAIEVSKLTEQQTGATTNMTAICQNMIGLIKQ
ncbi:UNVERIFIED_CONTAM: methyl-accepting chemotaxis protein [Acetivibrio alkalicellulosi]